MSLDLSGYLDVFADEAREHLQALNDALLEFEKDDGELEHVNVMFRSAHTLKGMSATMGFNEIAALTHQMENLLTPIRQGDLAANGDIVDSLFQCLDMLQEMVEAHINQQEHGVDVSDLVARLEQLATGESAPAPAAAKPRAAEPAAQAPRGYPGELSAQDRGAITTARNNGKEVFWVSVRLEDSCDLKNVRAFMVLKELKTVGEILHATPSETALTEQAFGSSFDLLLASEEEASEVERLAGSVLEIESATVLVEGAAGPVKAPAAQADLAEIFSFNDYDRAIMQQALSETYRVLHAHVELADDCTLKSARAFMVHKKLEEAGEIINVSPDVEDIEFERFDQALDFLVLIKGEIEPINKDLNAISEIASVVLKEYTELPSTDSKAAPAAAPAVQEAAAAPQAPTGKELKKAAQPKPQAKAPTAVKQTHTIRVDTERLDQLLNLAGELVIGKTRLLQLASEIKRPELTDTIEQFDLIVFDLQNVIMQTRMVPIETVFNRFPRMIRDLAKQRGKQIELQITGGETELDRTVIDEIGDPLVHLIRNSIDHGIETEEERRAAGKPELGVLALSAYHEGNNVYIDIRDDGRGIDPDKIRKSCVKKGLLTEEAAAQLTNQQAQEMIFAAGLSTADQVTDISGRGVGMDVVTNKINELNGDVKLHSVVGQGTTITIKLPLTLAIVQALMVTIAKETYAIPLAYIETTIRIWPKDIQKVNQGDVTMLRGEILPLVKMRQLLKSPDVPHDDDSQFVVVVQSGQERYGLCVDQPIGQTEIVIKSLGVYLQNTPFIAGGTILGDGTVALILDVAHITDH
ncbi:chemotaxis protein CheA [bacterium]|nr:chemotaxis protein CheA [bacterium]